MLGEVGWVGLEGPVDLLDAAGPVGLVEMGDLVHLVGLRG
jgi:hypothetical protein